MGDDGHMALRVTALAGGIGGARFLTGLKDVVPDDATITVVANTADDITLHGLRVSPDLDTLMYTLGGGIHPEQGWGRAEETFSVAGELAAHGHGPEWFTLGDKDFATHIIRTRMLGLGYTLSEVTAALCDRWQPGVTLLPMTDDPVETHVVVRDEADPESLRAIHFQEWWVRQHAAIPAERFTVVGLDRAAPAPGVLEALGEADVILLPPSNPVVSIGTILGVPGVREALRDSAAPVVGVSPIIGGAPVRGMADACLQAIGVETSAAGVAGLYQDFLDGWLVAEQDSAAVAHLTTQQPGLRVVARPLVMSGPQPTAEIAAAAMELALELRGDRRG